MQFTKIYQEDVGPVNSAIINRVLNSQYEIFFSKSW